MADSTLYDVLEVSSTASTEMIDAAYQRLSEKFDPANEENAKRPHARIQLDAVKQAYLTLGDPEKRLLYDRKIAMRATHSHAYATVPDPAQQPFWTVPKMIIVGVIVVGVCGFYFKHQQEKARIEVQKVIEVARAKEAEAKARADAEAERTSLQLERERQRAERMEAAQRRAERDADVRQFQRDARVNDASQRVFSAVDRDQARRDEAVRRSEEMRIRREEAQAANAARQQLAREKAELCRIERDRYGKSISC